MERKTLTHQDAELVLRLYEIRREVKMREARDIVNGKFWPESYADVVEVTNWEHSHNAAFRQTSTYWEMVYGMARRGIIDAEYLMESNGEGLVLFSKIEPFLADYRKDFGEVGFQNAEWVTQNSETGKDALARIQKRLAKFRQMTRTSDEDQ